MTAIDLSGDTGLVAIPLLLHILFGLLISVRYSPWRHWPQLNGAPVGLLDGERLYIEVCLLAVVAAALFRLRCAFCASAAVLLYLPKQSPKARYNRVSCRTSPKPSGPIAAAATWTARARSRCCAC